MFIIICLLYAQIASGDPWVRGTEIPAGGRANPYELSAIDFQLAKSRGAIHPFVYPVEITGSLLPLRPIQDFLDNPSMNPLRALMQSASVIFSNIHSFKEAMQWLGLHNYPDDAGTSTSSVPLPEGFHPGDPMGLTRMERFGRTGMTFSCAGCHVGQIFGKPVFGMTNRFPRANVFFQRGRNLTRMIASPFFAMSTGSDEAETEMYRGTRKNMLFVQSKRPLTLGLDTSLASVAMSLARRRHDDVATKDWRNALAPEDEPLARSPADSKPAVWWNLKYKNRWLSDGSVVSGNPIFTNFLWNEIGRGTDLTELADWMTRNKQVMMDLTTAVFSTEAPRLTDFFPAEKIDINRAKRGQRHFNQYCARCHGHYEKAWDASNADQLNYVDQLKTVQVNYHAKTPVIDVGTDPNRRLGMKSLERLNELKISQENGAIVEMQKGYVPPPLVGIWARWPYFHNNSAPSLCAVLTPAAERPTIYWAGEPLDKERDFDFECNGYPQGEKMPTSWRRKEFEFDTTRTGLSNAGHDGGILVKDGREVMSLDQKLDLIQYLQTL